MPESNEQPKGALAEVARADLLADLKQAMLALEKEEGPIRNDGSYSMRLLWQMYEQAFDRLEKWEDFERLEDSAIEGMFEELSPNFVAGYPRVLNLS